MEEQCCEKLQRILQVRSLKSRPQDLCGLIICELSSIATTLPPNPGHLNTTILTLEYTIIWRSIDHLEKEIYYLLSRVSSPHGHPCITLRELRQMEKQVPVCSKAVLVMGNLSSSQTELAEKQWVLQDRQLVKEVFLNSWVWTHFLFPHMLNSCILRVRK